MNQAVNLRYVGSSPTPAVRNGDVAQLVERCLCKADVAGSTPVISIL